MTLALPVRASRLTSAVRQLLIGAPFVIGAALLVVLLLFLAGMGWALAFLIPAAPASMLLGAWVAKRAERALNRRQPGVVLEGSALRIPVGGEVVTFQLDRPFVAEPGWWRYREAGQGVFVILKQDGQSILLLGDDGEGGAQKHQLPRQERWPELPDPREVRRVWMWASDVMELILALRRHQA